MKKSNSVKAVVFLVLITVAVAAICFFVRTDIPEGTLRIDHNGQRVDLLLEQFELVPVQGTVINGKGEERNINVQGILLSNVLQKLDINECSLVTVVADDEYSAQVTWEEIAHPGKVYLIQQEEGGMQLIIFGDNNSKRNVSDVVRLSVQ